MGARLVTALEASPIADATEAVNVREIRRAYDRAVKMPSRLVEEIAKTVSQAQNFWAEARKKNDFPAFATGDATQHEHISQRHEFRVMSQSVAEAGADVAVNARGPVIA